MVGKLNLVFVFILIKVVIVEPIRSTVPTGISTDTNTKIINYDIFDILIR